MGIALEIQIDPPRGGNIDLHEEVRGVIYGLTTHAFLLKEGNHFHLYKYLQWKEKGVAKVHSRCHSSVGYRGSVKASGGKEIRSLSCIPLLLLQWLTVAYVSLAPGLR